MSIEASPHHVCLAVGGGTVLVGIVGFPVAQVRSPALLSEAFRKEAIDAIQMPFHVRPEDLAVAMDGLKRIGNFAGLVFTVPHKIAAMKFADTLTPVAQAAGSINVLRREADGRWHGDNVDGVSFVRGLGIDGVAVRGASAMIAGCGGVGGAICAALAEAGIGALHLFDVDRTRCEAVAVRLAEAYPEVAVTVLEAPSAKVGIAVNCTALGMRAEDPLPFDPAVLPPGAAVAEVVMKPRVTRLLDAARASGHPVSLGENLLNNQLELLKDFFAAAYTW